ncbi:hypothetical protein ACJX0J_011548 [Zea mays]
MYSCLPLMGVEGYLDVKMKMLLEHQHVGTFTENNSLATFDQGLSTTGRYYFSRSFFQPYNHIWRIEKCYARLNTNCDLVQVLNCYGYSLIEVLFQSFNILLWGFLFERQEGK